MRFNQNVEDWHVWVTMVQREEQRDQVRERILEEQDQVIEVREQELEKRQAVEGPEIGDLLLLRWFTIIKNKGRKLETYWKGPYKVI